MPTVSLPEKDLLARVVPVQYRLVLYRLMYAFKKQLASLHRQIQQVVVLQQATNTKDQRQSIWLQPFEENVSFYMSLFSQLVAILHRFKEKARQLK